MFRRKVAVLGYTPFLKTPILLVWSLQRFVFSALQVTGMALWFASPEIRRCKDFVISAVRRTGALQEVYHCYTILDYTIYIIPYHTMPYCTMPCNCLTFSLIGSVCRV